MAMQVRWNMAAEAWSEFVARCPGATFYHAPGWYQAQAYRGYRLAPVHFRFPTGEEAMLPLALTNRFKGLVVEARSGIEAGYGGLIAPQPLTAAQVEQAYDLVRARYPEFTVTSNPHSTFANAPAALAAATDFTQVVPLLPRDAQLKLMSKGRRKSLRQAEDECYDLVVNEGVTRKDLDAFYPVYAEHSAKWGYDKWRRDASYFRSLIDHAGPDLVLFMAYHEGEAAGFRLFGCHGTVVLALHLARAARFEDGNVGPFLVAESMSWAQERGYTHLDFMPSGQLESVRTYKASYGCDAVPYTVSSQQTGWVASSLERLRSNRRPVLGPA